MLKWVEDGKGQKGAGLSVRNLPEIKFF